MAKGYLKVNVYSDTVANPIANATIDIIKNGEVIDSVKTNENGETEKITLNTVDKSYSEEEQYEVKPYETYDLLVKALGLRDKKIEGVQILADTTSLQEVYLESIDEGESEQTDVITPNTLWGNYPEKISEDQEETETGITTYVLQRVEVPQNIIVHDGTPSNTSAKNYTVPFIDYIKNVASSEIYSTWPEETIKANVLAIISFTLNRIYTEWYRNKGYDFTITSTTTYDQKYTRGGTIFEPISNIVDDIFNNYLKSGIMPSPLLAHYKNKTSEKGYLSQWGSKNLGDKGYNALRILQYYYGNNINIYEAEVIEDYPYSFTTNLKEGDCSNDVYILQNALNYIRGSYPGIPVIENPSGKFDNQTKDAVEVFQKVFNLSRTGIVNYQTWYKISYILTAVTDMTESIYK